MAQGSSGYEYPADMSFYPRWKARFVIRFAEFGQLSTLQKKTPPIPTRSIGGTSLNRGGLTVVLDPTAPSGVTRFVLQGPGTTPVGAPGQQVSSPDGLTQIVEGVVPREFQWSMAGLHTASTLRLTLRFVDCPIDPRTVRSVAVEFYLGTVTAAQAGAQIAGASGGAGTSAGSSSPAQPMDLIPDTYTDGHGNPRTNLRFEGWVNDWEVEWNDGEPQIHMECVDNTHLLLNIPAPAKAVIDKSLPIDKAIAQYLTFSPSFQGLTVEYRPNGLVPPSIAGTADNKPPVLGKHALRPGLGPPLAKGGAAAEKHNVWDYLTDTVRALGHSIYVDGSTVVIQRMRSITSANVQGRDDDPYVLQGGRNVLDGQSPLVRKMIYGRNVKSMRLKRNFTKNAPANISIRSYNPEQKQVLVERFPTHADRQVYNLPGGTAPDEKWLEITAPAGIIDRATLRILAQEYYENLWRQEVGWEVETMNFASFGGGNEDPDLLDLKFGDPFQILTARDEQFSTATELESDLSAIALNAARLEGLGFETAFAQAYSKAYTDQHFPTIYRTHKLDVSGTEDSGVSFKIEAVNYVEVTSDKSLAPGEEPPVTTPKNAPASPKAGPPKAGPPPAPAGPAIPDTGFTPPVD